jgi:hypothetical protein
MAFRRPSRDDAVTIIQRNASAKTLKFGIAALKRMSSADRDTTDVCSMLSRLVRGDVTRGPEEGRNFPDCDVFAVVVEDDPDQYGRVFWYMHITIHRVIDEVKVVSFKPEGSPA